ncbi:family 43 glycosylhydrolase [Parabacteroides sp. FAFU027]|uniref:family 43 glycosylhydrolase n=1 Tax=Parabacteroides sp. FAFU027 TaxID=2922715 RepID=UPI001FB02385|nr:family 43 glycosylhydrolase [Parabacteroides sp. FAFU027]
MKKTTTLLLFLLLMYQMQAQQQFSHPAEGTYLNPVFAGDYPDPSILRDGKDYYIVHSSFEYYPGLQIWHSTDLINWQPVAAALHKYVGSVWAPDLVKYKNRYYIYFPANNTNYVVSAPSIEGPWSNPVDLKIGYIDPGHITDEKGNRYLYFSNGTYVPLSEDGLRTTGEARKVYDGWTIPNDWSIECFCMEGPKLTKHGDYYYLTVAEGGTAGPATGHMIISARSRSPLGPWENSPYNPILRAQNNSQQWCSIGHGTLFDDAANKSWILFHGYENGHYNMGRQTMLLPVEWTQDGWYKIAQNAKVDQPVQIKINKNQTESYNLNDDFSGKELKSQWKFFGEYNPGRFKLENQSLELRAQGHSVADCSPMLCIPPTHSYMADVELSIEGNATGGLVLFYNKQACSGILADSCNILANLRGWQFPTVKNLINRHVYLRLVNKNNTVDMYYSKDGKQWVKIENSLEVSGMHHNVLSGFMSLRIGLCAMGDGVVRYKNFRYTVLP